MPANEKVTTYPRFNYAGKDATVADAIAHKLIREASDRESSSTEINKGTTPVVPNEGILNELVNLTSSTIEDCEAIMEMLPDVKLIMEILTSSILSPKDMASATLTYSSNLLEGEGLEVDSSVLAELRNFFDVGYSLPSKLPDMLRDMLIRTGSHPVITLPEGLVDSIIHNPDNISTEAISGYYDTKNNLKGLGIIGTSNKTDDSVELTLESLATTSLNESKDNAVSINDFLTFSDNPHNLKTPIVHRALLDNKINRQLGLSRASVEKRNESDNTTAGDLFINHKYKDIPNIELVIPQTVEGDVSRNLGHPIEIFAPSEALIPVTSGANKRDPLGYILVTDGMGNAVSRDSASSQYSKLTSSLTEKKVADASDLLKRVEESIMGTSQQGDGAKDLKELETYHEQLVMQGVLNSLQNGVYGEGADITPAPEVMRILFSRFLTKTKTKLVYIPKHLVTYFAFDHNTYGIGKSLLEDVRVIASIRVSIMLANVMAAVRNGVSRTILDITLDPEDVDPDLTIETIIAEHHRRQAMSIPIGETNPVSALAMLERSGTQCKISGHPEYPETAIDVSVDNSSHGEVDTELEDRYRDIFCQGLGVTPDQVDASKDVDFATTIHANHLLQSKRINLYSDLFCKQLTGWAQLYMRSSGVLMDIINKGVKFKGKKEGIDENISAAEVFIQSFEISLPKADQSKTVADLEAYEKFADAVDTYLDAYISEDMLGRVMEGDVVDAIEPTRLNLRGHILRQWLKNNNIGEEISTLLESADSNLKDINEDYTEMLMDTVESFMLSVKEQDRKITDKLDDEVAEHEAGREAELDKREAELEEREAALKEAEGGDETTDTATDTDNTTDDEAETDTTDDEAGDEELTKPIEEDGEGEAPAEEEPEKTTDTTPEPAKADEGGGNDEDLTAPIE